MNAIAFYRVANWLFLHNVPFLPPIITKIIFLIYNSYIPYSASIGDRSVFAYGGIGVVIHANAKIGCGCVLGQGITIGAIEGYASSRANLCPTVGNNCYIGAGARLLGNITIGNNCQIGAGSVIINDVPNGSIVVGVPGRIVGITDSDFTAIITS